MIRFILIFCMAMPAMAVAKEEKAIVAGGCFWCVESDFEKVEGVREVVSGYTGGTLKNPTYKNHDGHTEAVEITFDSDVISYKALIALFLTSVDVTDGTGQFCDRGNSYKAAIYPTAEQSKAANEAKDEAQALLGAEIITPIIEAKPFWIAEDYHQNYYKSTDYVVTRRGPMQKMNAYKFYRDACGRDARVKQVWGDNAFGH
jgi:peptide-methionine (S)-S-oxide reductase